MSRLNVVTNRLIAELYAAANIARINLASLNFRQNGLCTLQERFFDIFACFCARLEKYQIIVLRKVARLQESDFTLLLEILLVANENDDDVWTGKGACIVEPV